jgi:hypothetical protein
MAKDGSMDGSSTSSATLLWRRRQTTGNKDNNNDTAVESNSASYSRHHRKTNGTQIIVAAMRPLPQSDYPNGKRESFQSWRRRTSETTKNNNTNKNDSSRGTQHPLRPQSSRGGSESNWRSRQIVINNNTVTTVKNNRNNAKVLSSVEDDAATLAMENLKCSILSIINNEETLLTNSEDSIKQLMAALFCNSLCSYDSRNNNSLYGGLNITTQLQLLPGISNTALWDTSYSLIHLLQQLLLSTKQQQCQQIDDKRLLHMQHISSVTLSCLQLLTIEQTSTTILILSDIRLCECAEIIIKNIDTVDDSSFTLENNDMIVKQFKATLFLCLGKLLSLSNCASGSGERRRQRGLLFPWGAEKTANMVIKIVIPYLDYLGGKHNGHDSSVYGYGAMECLYLLLRDPNWDTSYELVIMASTTNYQHTAQLSKHAAAIFAPLIVDVLPDGKERHETNPLRSSTLNAVCSFWELSYELLLQKQREQLSMEDSRTDQMILVVNMSCQCLAAALNAIYALRRNKTQTEQEVSNEIDVSAIARQLQSMIRNDELLSYKPKVLSLLTLLGLAYPTSFASQWHLFLEDSAGINPCLLSILDKGAIDLENGNFQDESWIALPIALRATSILLTAMPFTLWIAGESRPSMRTSGGNFSSRVRKSLLNIMKCILNVMTAIKDKVSCDWPSNELCSLHATTMHMVMMHVANVTGILCNKLPFNGENSILLHSSSLLLQCAGDIYVQSTKACEIRLSASKVLDLSSMNKIVSIFSRVIMENLGAGSSASNSEAAVLVSKCSAPAERWLSDSSSFDFIGLLLNDSCWHCSTLAERFDMLSAVAKCSPWTLVREPFNLASFFDVCVVQSQNPDTIARIQGIKLIESFIVGRKTSSVECTHVFSVISQKLCPILLDALEDNSAAIRTSATTSLGSLVRHDWISLLISDAEEVEELSIDWTPLESILRLCFANTEKVSSVRSSACKAIGDISTCCIHRTFYECAAPLSNDFVITFADKVCEVMAKAVSDRDAKVRSMALFAVGNLSLAMKMIYADDTSPAIAIMKRSFVLANEYFSDKDEKVVANAIRTISHTAYFVYEPKFSLANESHDTLLSIEMFRSLVAKLSAKVSFALDDAVGESPKGLTWKQRKGATKQSWGSCTTLGVLLSFTNILPHIDYTLLDSAMSGLFRCLQLSNLVNEKIFAAAVKALLGMPVALWQFLSCKCDCIGLGLATLYGHLDERYTKTPHYHEVEKLATVLLVQARDGDFRRMFLFLDSIPFSVEYFYQWLVARNIDACILGEIAAAVVSVDVAEILDVSLAHMFLSRANQRHDVIVHASGGEVDKDDEL